MNCPRCNNDSRVLDTRNTSDNREIRRRRECMACRLRWTTYETMTSTATADDWIRVASQAFTIHQQVFNTTGAAHVRTRRDPAADRQQPGRQRDGHADDHRTKVDPIARDRAAVQRLLACGDLTRANPPQPTGAGR